VSCQGDGLGWKRNVCRTSFQIESKFVDFRRTEFSTKSPPLVHPDTLMFWMISTRFHCEGPMKGARKDVRICKVYVRG